MGQEDVASPFGLGCVSLGTAGRAGIRLVHRALELGVCFFDTADAYGDGSSERVVGRALRRRRDQAFVATKAGYLFKERTALASAARGMAIPVLRRARSVGRASAGPTAPLADRRAYSAQDFSPEYLRAALEASLRRLQTDYVDLYQLHGPVSVCADDVMALMATLRSEGKIRGFGVGLEDLDHAMDWLGTGAVSSIQIPFGVLDPAAGAQIIPAAGAHGISVVARGVFAGGLLVDRPVGDDSLLRSGQPEVRRAVRQLASSTGFDVLQIAAWFVTSHPGVTTVLLGTSSVRHLEQNLRYVEAQPPHDMVPLLRALAEGGVVTGAGDSSPPEGTAP